MKKFLIFFAVCSFSAAFAQCVISGPDQIQVGERSKYAVENPAENCASCYEWHYPDQKIFLEGNTKQNELTVKGAVPGTAVLTLNVSAPGGKTKCEKTITVIAPLTDVISPDAKCDFSPVEFKEIRVSDGVVAFSTELAGDYKYLWTVTYRNGETKTSAEKVPHFNFGNDQAIDKVELDLTLNKCSKKFTKMYDSNYWYFF